MVSEELRKKLPIIKKTISDFMMGEEGRISKESILKTGAVLGSMVLASILSSTSVLGLRHTNSLTLQIQGGEAQGMHSNHANHGNRA